MRAALGVVVVSLTAPAVASIVPLAVAGAVGGTPTAGQAQVLWTADVGQPLPTDNDDSGPLVALNGTTLSGVTRTSGSVAWQDQLPGSGSGPCAGAVAGGMAFVACPNGATTHSGATVVAVNVATGRTRWERSTTTWSAAQMSASDGVVVLTGDFVEIIGNDAGFRLGGVYALNANSGMLLWHQKAPDTQWLVSTPSLASAPLATDGVVLVPPGQSGNTAPGNDRAVDATTGVTLWSTAPNCHLSPSSVLTSPRQTLYMSCNQNGRATIDALDATSGTVEWTAPLPEGWTVTGVLNITTTVLIVGTGLVAAGIDRATGATLWVANGRYLDTATSLVYFLQPTKPIDGLSPDAGKVLDVDTGATLGTFAFAGGWVPSGEFAPQSSTEVIMHTGTGPTIAAVRLPTAGWTPPSVALVPTPDGGGYWLAGQDGGVFAYGDAPFEGSLPALGVAVDDIVSMAATPDGRGYWLVGEDGGVFAFGDAHFYGSAASLPLDAPVVGIAPTPDGDGYWLVGTDGGVFAYGDAHFYGINTTRPAAAGQVVGISPTLDGGGYWQAVLPSQMVPFGDAQRFGNRPANVVPVPSMTTTPDRSGYWFIGQDGGVFSAGNAQFYGSVPGLDLRIDDAVDIASTPDGGGYWVLGTNGGVFAFGDAGFYGSRG